jgi:hypothetical protein
VTLNVTADSARACLLLSRPFVFYIFTITMSPTTPRKSAKRNQITDSDDELTPPPASPGPSQSPPAKRLRRQRSPIASDIHSDDNDDDYDARESSPLSVLSSPSASPNPHKPSKSTTKRIKMADTARTSRSRATAKTKRSRGGSSQDTASAQVASETVKPASPLPSSAKSLSQPDPIPPKKKLGPIPKKGNGSSSNTPNPVAPTKPAKLSVPLAVRPTDLDESGSLRLGSKGGNKSASNDVDLSNSDVYKTLFGLNRSSNQKPGNSVNKASIPSGSGNR